MVQRKKRSAHPTDSDFRGDILEGKEVETQVTEKGSEKLSGKAESNSIRNEKMSMIDPTEWGMDDIREPYTLPAGSEEELEILTVQRRVSEETEIPFYIIRLGIIGHPYSKDVQTLLTQPFPGKMDAKRLNTTKFYWKQFCDCFGIDMLTPQSPVEDWPKTSGNNYTGVCILSKTTSEEYGEQNGIKKYLPRR
jgi:hypothetical protein